MSRIERSLFWRLALANFLFVLISFVAILIVESPTSEVPSGKYFSNSESVDEFENDGDCAEQFRKSYFHYRKDKNILELETNLSIVDSQKPPPRILFDYRPNSSFQPNEDLLNCAAKNGDQLANFILGLRLIEGNHDIENFGRGLAYIGEANKTKSSAPETCRKIDELQDYECRNGLPEASLLIGQIYGNCKVPYYDKEFASSLLWHAARNFTYESINVYDDFISIFSGYKTCYGN